MTERQMGKAGERYGQRYLPAVHDRRSARRCTAHAASGGFSRQRRPLDGC